MVSIVEVTTKAQLRKFVDYPNRLYEGVPQFVPATYDDDLSDWDRSKNPAFEYCDARCWLAERDGDVPTGGSPISSSGTAGATIRTSP